MTETAEMRRISLMIREDQYQRLTELELNISGLVRDLIDDHLSAHRVTISVSSETQRLYEKVVANTGATDEVIETYLRRALKQILAKTIEELTALQSTID